MTGCPWAAGQGLRTLLDGVRTIEPPPSPQHPSTPPRSADGGGGGGGGGGQPTPSHTAYSIMDSGRRGQ